MNRQHPLIFPMMRIEVPRPLTVAVLLVSLIGACEMPTSDAPQVKSNSPSGTTVEYSGERGGEADQKAQEACAQQGKRAAGSSTTAGSSGGTLRSYNCVK